MNEELKAYLKKLASRDCWEDDEDFNACDYCGENFDGENFDGAYYGGCADGEANLARHILATYGDEKMINHRYEVEATIDDWLHRGNCDNAKSVINCLIEFLAEDMSWLRKNISEHDRNVLISVADALKLGCIYDEHTTST